MDSDSGAEEITAPPSPLDENTRAYFDKLVPHRVFIQNGDTFLGKYLIKVSEIWRITLVEVPI